MILAAPLGYTALAYIPMSEARGFTPIFGQGFQTRITKPSCRYPI